MQCENGMKICIALHCTTVTNFRDTVVVLSYSSEGRLWSLRDFQKYQSNYVIRG
jgi:hypothetical protein